jgi:hypothetical protein
VGVGYRLEDGMNAETLLQLAERCEKATGPDRELDDAILLAAHGGSRPMRPVEGMQNAVTTFHPHYTTSLDAAMALAPEGWWLTLDRYIVSDEPNQLTWRAWFNRLVGDLEGSGPAYSQKVLAPGATAALALTAAALRARAAMEQGK